MTSIISVNLVQAALRSEDLRDIPPEELEQDARDYEGFLCLVKEHPDQRLAHCALPWPVSKYMTNSW